MITGPMIRRWLDTAGNRLAALVTGLPTEHCACGFSTRCGYQWTSHKCEGAS